MFLQVWLKERGRKYHRCLCRPTATDPPTVLQFTRLVFGVKASPYLAGRTLQETANQFSCPTILELPEINHHNFYVDDILNCFAKTQQAIDGRQQITSLLQAGGFHIRMWMTNSPEVLASIPYADRAPEKATKLGGHDHCAYHQRRPLV